MKKVSARFVILCIVVVLIGVTALAVGGSVSNLQKQDANVEVKTITTEEEPAFHITLTNAEDGKLYTVLIRSGAENDNPSGGDNGNLVYMDVVKAENGVVSISKAYPKTMANGTYRVFMSDYQQGKVKQVATFEVSGNGGIGADKPDNTRSGNFDGIDGVDVRDVVSMIDLIVNEIEPTEAQLQIADFDDDGKITVADVVSVISIIVD